jgi:hypothetical protein
MKINKLRLFRLNGTYDRITKWIISVSNTSQILKGFNFNSRG